MDDPGLTRASLPAGRGHVGRARLRRGPARV
ncbi:hypothetical protein Ae150APs1_1690 [Pseudonocardia sp. Ae150A_Ps1]|nr:hypothetical protein Ae150APs1_1690 [Pseudonocardia sp. Ae150A_Ps1]